jgi:hypothetical protein
MILTTAKSRVASVAWIPVALGLTGLVALLISPVAAMVVGTAVALVALVCRTLIRASGTLDRIMAEELDHRPGNPQSHPADRTAHAE